MESFLRHCCFSQADHLNQTESPIVEAKIVSIISQLSLNEASLVWKRNDCYFIVDQR